MVSPEVGEDLIVHKINNNSVPTGTVLCIWLPEGMSYKASLHVHIIHNFQRPSTSYPYTYTG